MAKLLAIEVEEIPLAVKRSQVFLINGKGLSDYTHGIFKYPCKFIPHIPRWFLKKYGNETTKQYGVLDPFVGSGTTLVESCLLGLPSYGIDIDPLSCLLSKVKSAKFTDSEIKKLESVINKILTELDKKIDDKKIAKFIPEFKEVRYWFPRKAIADLARIKFLIAKYSKNSKSDKIKNFLTIVLASIIRKVSFAEEQSPKPYISKKVKKNPADVNEVFTKNLVKYFQAIRDFSQTSISSGKVIGYEARKVNTKQIKNEKVHLAMTSPPYINAFDYVRSLKLENIWLDSVTPEDISNLYDKQIGTEKIPINKYKNPHSKTGILLLDKKLSQIYAIDKKRSHVVADYFDAMAKNLQEVHKVLLNNGYYCVVVGDSRIRGIEIPTSRIIIDLAKMAGFALTDDFSYIIRNRYLRIPRMGRGGLIPRDYILVFKK